MSHLRMLICRVEDETEEMTELASVALPARWVDAPLDTLETRVATAGQHLLGRLCELLYEHTPLAVPRTP